LDVRHGRGLLTRAELSKDALTNLMEDPASRPEGVINNSHALHSQVTAACEAETA
jgi:hypothetical protein